MRDPRISPKPGDKLHNPKIALVGWKTITVSQLREIDGMVRIETRRGGAVVRARVRLDEWQGWAKDARVVHAAR